MALDIQTVDLTPDYVPYERPPEQFTLWSAIPRGLQSFIASVQLDAKALNDTALLNLNATLPPNFGYVLMDVNVSISQDTAVNWSAIFNLNLQQFYRATGSAVIGLNGNWVQEFNVNDAFGVVGRALQVVQPWPSFPMIGTPTTAGILINMTMANPAAGAALAGTVNAYMSWWQFDLEQIRKFPINSPIPTHPR